MDNNTKLKRRRRAPLSILSLVLLIACIVAIALAQSYRSASKPPPYLLYAPPSVLSKFTFGYNDTFADMLWVRLLQDIDTCEQHLAPKGQTTAIGPEHIANCKKGWAYRMLDAITELSPHWRQPATVGPIFLSVIVDDIDGASALFRKVIKVFPNDWTILFRAGYHFLYEVHDYVYAAELYEAAAKNGAPDWVPSLVAKLYSESGRNHIARVVVSDAIKRTPPGPARTKLIERLKEIDKKILATKGKDIYSADSVRRAELRDEDKTEDLPNEDPSK